MFILLTSASVCYADEHTYTELTESGYIRYADLAFNLVSKPLARYLGFKKAQEHGHELLHALIVATLDAKEKPIFIAIKRTCIESDRYKVPEKQPKSIMYELAQLTAIEYNRQAGQTTSTAAITLRASIPVSRTYTRKLTVVPIQDNVLIKAAGLLK